MYSLDFIDELESVKEKTLEIQKRYKSLEKKMIDMQQEMTEMLEQLKQISNRNCSKFKDKLKECEKAEQEYSDILKIYEELEEKLELIKEYVKIKLKYNKGVLEKYKDIQDNENKEEKIIQLLGEKTAEERIMQCKKALDWLEEDYRTDRFEEMYTVFEKILGIERQKIQIKFEAKTNIYTYLDELGNEMKYVLFGKDRNGLLINKFTAEDVQLILNIAKEKGLTNKQIKKIDVYIAIILKQDNLEMFDNYIETIRRREEIKFVISYDLRTNGMKKEDLLIRKELNKIKKYAIRQKNIGIATIIRDETKLIAIMRFLKIYPIVGNRYKTITEGNNIK